VEAAAVDVVVTVASTVAATRARRPRALPPVSSSPSSVVASDEAAVLPLLLKQFHTCLWSITDKGQFSCRIFTAFTKRIGHGGIRRNERMILRIHCPLR
jgi:hypothetical protein